jgi:anti-sigma-K factor RskA
MAANHPDLELIPYLRGELSAEDRVQVELHLQQCADCRESAESSSKILADVARSVEAVPAPDWSAYRAELRRKLADSQSTDRGALSQWWRPLLQPRRVFWSPAAGLAGVAILAIALAIRPGASPQAPEDAELAMEQDMNGADVGLLVNYHVVEHLDLLENYDLIEHLDELGPADRQTNETSS